VADPIIFYFDPLSPFAYIGSVEIERVGKRHGRDVEWRPVLLGVTVLKVMGMRPLLDYPLKGPYLRHDAERLAAYFDVPLRSHGLKHVNSLAACRAYLWARRHAPDRAKPLAQALFARLWQKGLDITSVEAVIEEAAALDLDTAALRAALAAPDIKAALQASVEDAMAQGVFGVPSFQVDGELFWGNDHIWMLEHWLQHHRFAR
jgi:2-hydroxychromene-2-carboxylate isomerase